MQQRRFTIVRLGLRTTQIAWLAICVAMFAWIGFSAYAKITAKEASVVKETVVDTSAIDNYVSGLSSDTQ